MHYFQPNLVKLCDAAKQESLNLPYYKGFHQEIHLILLRTDFWQRLQRVRAKVWFHYETKLLAHDNEKTEVFNQIESPVCNCITFYSIFRNEKEPLRLKYNKTTKLLFKTNH